MCLQCRRRAAQRKKNCGHEHCHRFIPCRRMCWTVYSVPAWESLACAPAGGVPGVGKDRAGAFAERVLPQLIFENLTFEAPIATSRTPPSLA
jgi:hypothetical protein